MNPGAKQRTTGAVVSLVQYYLTMIQNNLSLKIKFILILTVGLFLG